MDAKIRFSVWNKDNKMLNAVYMTANELEEGKRDFEGKDKSTMLLLDYQCFDRPSFLDYLRSGIKISIVGAIDYTASNGNPSS
jgi:hypothetical protein